MLTRASARGSLFLESQVLLAETLVEKASAVAYFQDVFLKHDTPQSKNFSF